MKIGKLYLSSRTLAAKSRLLTKAMFSLHDPKGLWAVLNRYGWQMLSIATQTRRIAPRVRRLFAFAQFLLKMEKHHGSAYTIKWLKACTVAVQRAVAKDPVSSLREIEPGLPLPRVARNGLPVIIGPSDRRQIMVPNLTVIRLWMSIFSLYRILEGPMVPKIRTITDPCTATQSGLVGFKGFVTHCLWIWLRPFGVNPKWIQITARREKPFLSRAAGPNVSMSIAGILTDALAWKETGLMEYILKYMDITSSRSVRDFFLDILRMTDEIVRHGASPARKIDTWRTGLRLGQLAFKEEAAGKLRIFAITDYWTQWLLQPLHTTIFRILRSIPSDATFDQEAGITRISQISVVAKCAYSFDLSAATDRVPLLVQSHILDILTGIIGYGEAWANLLVQREWVFPTNPYGLEGSVKYATGQPMGALSSWAMLALTHHMMVQFAAYRAGHKVGDFLDYCILGDDLVICDHEVASHYLAIAKDLGVEINLAKSLQAKQEGFIALEFAKRFVVNGKPASPVSFKQLVSATSLAGRVQNLLYFGYQGLVQTESLFGVILARFGSDVLKPFSLQMKQKGFQHGLLGALGSLYRKGMVPLELLVEACANPQEEELDISENSPFSLPSAQAMRVLKAAFNGSDNLGYPWSHQEQREEFRTDLLIGDDLLLLALKARKVLADTYDSVVDEFAHKLVATMEPNKSRGRLPICVQHFDTIRSKDRVLAAQLRSIAEFLLVGDKDPVEYYEELLSVLEDERHEQPPLADAMKVSEDTILYTTSFCIKPTPERAYAQDEAWIALRVLRAGWPNVRIWRNPTTQPWGGWSQ